MAGMAPDKPDSEEDLSQDINAMIEEGVQGGILKHSGTLVIVNTGLLVLLAVWVGIYIQRISDLTARVEHMQSVEVLATRIETLTQEVNRLRDELDRMSRREAEDRQRR